MNPSREFLVFRGKEIIGSVGWWSDTWASAESGEGWRCTRSHLGLSLCRRFGGSENHGEYIKGGLMLEDQLPRQQEMNHQTAKGKLKLLLKNQAGHIN